MVDIKEPKQIRKLRLPELRELAKDIREFLISSISKTGGHIGANLATIELTIALHYVFNTPKETLIFDTGHQGYTHKILTGRASLFPTINRYKGLSRFLTRSESPYDLIDATHAGTSLSTAAGLASNAKNRVVAVIGDGSLVEGLAFEGLNYIAGTKLPIVIVINDNEMAIAKNVGGIKNLTQGKGWQKRSADYFQGLGYKYLSVQHGHNIGDLIKVLKKAKKSSGPIVVHVKTEKGRGLPIAKNHPYKMHFSMPFDPKTGLGASPTILGNTYAIIAADELNRIMHIDKKVMIITPATPYASNLDSLIAKYPKRIIDVGMAEQHALSMAAGMALGGLKPVVCFQTTFMQRAFDQLLHDVAFTDLPITILGVRSGFAGYDGPTHHGIFDLSYLRAIPNLKIVYPSDSADMRMTIKNRLANPQGPMVILHPYEPISKPEPKVGKRLGGATVFSNGKDGLILCLGNTLNNAHKIRIELQNRYSISFGLICVTSIKPLPKDLLISTIKKSRRILTMEEGTLQGGFGSSISEFISDNALSSSLLRSGISDTFISAGNKDECSQEAGTDAENILVKMFDRWPELKKNS